MVHRDVKSENIMLSIQGDVKLSKSENSVKFLILIVDFGLCIDNSINTRPSMVGSPYWMPPEMVWYTMTSRLILFLDLW